MSICSGPIIFHSRRVGHNFAQSQTKNNKNRVAISKPSLMLNPELLSGHPASIKTDSRCRFFSSNHLDGKVAIVTASTQGIGKAIAQRLAQDGAKVMISSRKEKNVKEALEDLRQYTKENSQVEGVVCNVGKAEDRDKLVQQTLDKFGGIDILISNAGTNPTFGPMLDCTEDQWDKIFDNNVKAAFLLTKMVTPHMMKKGEGQIVFIASIAGLQPLPMILPYSVSKTALLGLTKALSHDLAPENVRVNSVCPGIIDTNFASALTSNEFVANKTLEMLHIKRFGKPDDIAGIVSFLCSKDASYITGENIVVGGGIPSRL
jgi:dehydrogenase/reductase SDR family protein 4